VPLRGSAFAKATAQLEKHTNYETNPPVNIWICNGLARWGSNFGRFDPGVRLRFVSVPHLAGGRHGAVTLIWQVMSKEAGKGT